uniref:Synergin gamma C-terminal domain-containing protein n=2 Tax=Aplanochytrium stocchinoi TaxID=215587 RepID=A0A7S3PNS6_9STRA|mmetsp:Transcript_467/g.549  ORF Transcript_467/g.549 Transcript_467/m.549 type:complete len:230 (+) Transcript_467:233-922(+)
MNLISDLENKREIASSISNRSILVASKEGDYNRYIEFWHKIFTSIQRENAIALELLHGVHEALNSESTDSDNAKNVLQSNQFREYLLNIALMHNVGEHIYCSAALSLSENIKAPHDLDSIGKEWIFGKDLLLDKLEDLCIKNEITEITSVCKGKPEIIKEFYFADKWESVSQSITDKRCGLSLTKLDDATAHNTFDQFNNMPAIPHSGRKYILPVLNFWLNRVNPSVPI